MHQGGHVACAWMPADCLYTQSTALLRLFGDDSVSQFLQNMEQHFCNRLAVSCGPRHIRGSQVSQDKTITDIFAGIVIRCSASAGIWICVQACALAYTLVCMQYIALFAYSTLACFSCMCTSQSVSTMYHSLFKTCMDASCQQMLLSHPLFVHQVRA